MNAITQASMKPRSPIQQGDITGWAKGNSTFQRPKCKGRVRSFSQPITDAGLINLRAKYGIK